MSILKIQSKELSFRYSHLRFNKLMPVCLQYNSSHWCIILTLIFPSVSFNVYHPSDLHHSVGDFAEHSQLCLLSTQHVLWTSRSSACVPLNENIFDIISKENNVLFGFFLLVKPQSCPTYHHHILRSLYHIKHLHTCIHWCLSCKENRIPVIKWWR